jgi:predicted O-methyltransferase YrrM
MESGRAYWWHNLAKAAIGPIQCRLVEEFSDWFFAVQCHKKYHVIYVDGDHWGGSVVKDGINAWNALRVGGVLIFDDYLWTGAHETHEQPKAAIDYLLSLYQGRYTILDHSWQIILKKTSN